MVNIKITKRQQLLEVNNDMCHNYYYLIYGKFYNEDKTRYRKFKFVLWFDIFDVQEYFEDKEYITNDDIKEYMNEAIFGYTDIVKSYNDTDSLKQFYKICNDTINDYNRTNCRDWGYVYAR